jgi:hypothetical protein
VLRAEEAAAEPVDRLAGCVCALVRAFVDELGDDAQGVRGCPPEVGALARRPQEHDRANSGADREPPTLEPLRDGRVRRWNRHRQDEREDGAC